MRDPSDDWDRHCAKQEACAGERLGTCPLCGWDVGDEDDNCNEMVNNKYRWFHSECYREEYMKPCRYCLEMTERGLLDSVTGECGPCKATLDDKDGIWNREPGDHNERSE